MRLSHSPPPYLSCAGREEDKLDPTGAGTSEVGMASRWGRCSPDCSRNPQRIRPSAGTFQPANQPRAEAPTWLRPSFFKGTSVQEIQTDHDTIGSFERSKHYAIKLCQALDIAPDKMRVGVIQFGSSPRLEIALDSYTTKQELKKHMKKISYRGGSTQTGLALKYVLKKGFPGGRNSSTAAQIAILLSDGRSQGNAVQAAAQLKETGVVLFAPMESHVFFAEHFNDAVNGLFTSLSTFSVCNAIPAVGIPQIFTIGCHVEVFSCVRKTLETVKELQGNYMYTKMYKRHQTVCHRTICPDLLFLVEGSATLTLEGFLSLKSFLKRFLRSVIGSNSPSKVGLAVFGGETRVVAPVDKYKGDLKGLLRAVEALQPVGGEALTGEAVRYVTRHGFVSAPVFADVTDDLPRVVVLITATPAADEVVEPSKYARDREIFLIGVGPDKLKEQLNNITGNPQRTISYTPAEFSAKIPELKAKICSVDQQGCLDQAVDLVFALDASGAVSPDNFIILRDFVRSLTVHFDINRDVAQVALVSYGRRATTVFSLDKHDTGSSILKAVDEANYMGGVGSTGTALLHIHSEVLTASKGARPGVNKAVVLLTDGSGGDDAAVPAQKIRDNGVSVFVIGIGDVQKDRLLQIAGSEEHMISVPFYEDLKYFEDVLVQMLCSEVKKPVNLCRPNPCMNDGTCILSKGSFRCQCQGYEGPHCERKSIRPSSRGDLPRPIGLRKKSHQELLHHYKLHRRRHAV
ncbi:hypothetical protein F7725_014316 [Dissostichus mawsoni]|uniref:von Willebrand factor A domain containing 2 n=1 Tax=Dissostichus mawsoni TaxID=36200 RepID=A0A7J5YZX5_DISMA|nr:hypothetical protein F7725_014316 [Dissostichus mawsoni]